MSTAVVEMCSGGKHEIVGTVFWLHGEKYCYSCLKEKLDEDEKLRMEAREHGVSKEPGNV